MTYKLKNNSTYYVTIQKSEKGYILFQHDADYNYQQYYKTAWAALRRLMTWAKKNQWEVSR